MKFNAIVLAALLAAAPVPSADGAEPPARVAAETTPEAYLRAALKRDATPHGAARALLEALAMRRPGEDGAALADRLLAVMRMNLPRETFLEAVRLLHEGGLNGAPPPPAAAADPRPFPVPVTPNPVSPQN